MIGASLAVAVGAGVVGVFVALRVWIDGGRAELGGDLVWLDGGASATEAFDRNMDGDI